MSYHLSALKKGKTGWGIRSLKYQALELKSKRHPRLLKNCSGAWYFNKAVGVVK